MGEQSVQLTKKDMLFLFWIVVAVCAGFVGFAVGVTVFPTTVTTTNYYTRTSIQSVTSTTTETTPIYLTTYVTMTVPGYPGTQPGYEGLATVTFLTYSWNTTLDLVAIAVDPRTGSSISTAFQRDQNVYSPYIPYTYKAILNVNAGQTYWLIVKRGSAVSSNNIYMQLVYVAPGIPPIVIP